MIDKDPNWWEDAPDLRDYLNFQMRCLASKEDEINEWVRRQA